MHAVNRSLKLFLLIVLLNVFQAYGQTAASLLGEAKMVYQTNPDAAINKAKMAYQHANQTNQKALKLKSLNLISIFYWSMRNYQQAQQFAEKGLALAENYKIDSLTATLFNTSALIAYSKADYELAITRYQKALSIYLRSKDEGNKGLVYMNLGMTEKKLSRFDLANFYYFKAADIFRQLNDMENLCGMYNSIGNIFSAQGNLPNAIRYYRMAVSLSKKIDVRKLIAQSLNNLGYVYTLYNKPDSAIKYLSKCLVIRKTEKDSGLLVLTLQNLGEAWKQKGALKLASQHILHSVAIARKLDMKDELARGNFDLAKLYQQQKEYTKAIAVLIDAEQQALLLHNTELIAQCYGLRAKLYEQAGEYKSALLYEKKSNQLRDSLFNIAKSKSIAEIELKYETKQKDKDLLALHEQSMLGKKVIGQQKYTIITLVLASVLMLLLFLQANKSSRRKKMDNVRIQNLMKELHHRVKNNLQILSGLFTLQLADAGDENVKMSIRDNEMRLNSMNLIHQKLYLNETDTRIGIKEYLDQLVQHIQISFRDKTRAIVLTVDADDVTVEAEVAVYIGLIVNELTTNAYKYAFNKEGGELYVGFKRKKGDIFLLSVYDNGMGMEVIPGQPKKNSFGLKLVEMIAGQLNSEIRVRVNPGVAYDLDIKITK